MDTKKFTKNVYLKKFKGYSNSHMLQMAIIFTFIFIATIISIWLPIYFAYMSMNGL